MSQTSISTANPPASGNAALTLYEVARRTIFALLLLRASLDTALSALGGPIGALLNLAVIGGVIVLFASDPARRSPRIGLAWPFFFLFCAISISYTPDTFAAVRFLAVLATYCALFVAPMSLVREEKDIVVVLKVILGSSIIPIALGFGHIGQERAQASFSHPNIYAFYLAVILLTLTLVWFSKLYTHTMAERGMMVLLGAAAGGMLILTQTRGAWVGLALGLAVIALLYDRRLLWGTLAIPFLLLIPQVQERILDLKDETEFIGNGIIVNSYDWRLMLWESAFTWIKIDPIFGYGLFSFHLYSPKFFQWDIDGFNAHSVYVQLLFETGIFGLLAFIGIFLLILIPVLGAYRTHREAASFTVALCAFYLLICYSDNILFYLSFNWYFWLLLGTLRAWIFLSRERKSANDQSAVASSN